MKAAQRPQRIFVKLLLAYGLGIATGIAFPLGSLLLPLGIVLICLSAILTALHQKAHLGSAWGVLLMGWVAYIGLLNTHWANPTLQPTHYSNTANIPGLLIVSIGDVPNEPPNTYKLIAEVRGRKFGDTIVSLKGKVMLLLPLDSNSAKLKYGDILAVNSKLEPIQPPLNPYEFDYQQYLANKHIHYQLKPKPTRWYATGYNDGNKAYALITSIRNGAKSTLKQHITDPVLYGVASAMLLGDKDNLDAVTRQRYTLTGSMHVLAVSGMHVGILCWMLWLIVAPLKAMNKHWLRLVILLTVVWFYAILTGLSPSVMRASLMFSLYAIGETLKRKPDSLNIVAASALILLLVEPRQMLDVGFQLSYMAVLGIIFFYKPIRNLLLIKYKVPRLLWEGTCISIAAQLATLPLVVYYFHQFPLYALVANAGMLVLAPAVMLSGLLLLSFFWIPGIEWLLGKTLFYSLWAMDYILGLIAQLPNSTWKALYPTPLEMTLMLGMVVSLMIATQMRAVRPVLVAALLCVVLLGAGNVNLYQQKQQQHLAVYQFPQQTVLAGISGLNTEMWADSLALDDTTKMERSIYPFLHANGANLPEVSVLPNKPITNEYGMVGSMRFAILRKYTRRNLPKEPLSVDYLILSNNPSISMIQVKQVYKASVIILDGSNNIKAAERWMQESKVLGLNCHNTRNEAFIASW